MKQSRFAMAMMEMCMCIWCMYTAFCTQISDRFSISKVKHVAA